MTANSGQIRFQRDLYLHLLSINQTIETDDFLNHAVRLLVAIAKADQGYLEVRDIHGQEVRASLSFSSREIDQVQKIISHGVIKKALDDKQIIQTHSAITDPRFKERKSVQQANIKAVLCVPIYTENVYGVLYLQGGGEFNVGSEHLIHEIKLFTRHIAPLLDQLLINQSRQPVFDYTSELRKKYFLQNVVGKSKSLARVLKSALIVAPLSVNVLFTGNSGTGKTQMARIIHLNGFQAEYPFVELNCAALPENLIENELFGSYAGGHSGATRPVKGKIAAAKSGTLFLDEISELSFSAQAKLLQLMESGEYYPLGSSSPEKADVRVITASNIDLEEAVANRSFREDLYYRINTFTINMPDLAERKTDIEELADYFCSSLCQKHGLSPINLSASALVQLVSREWKGNIRELRHTIESALIRAAADEKSELLPEHLFPTEEKDQPDETSESSYKEATQQFQKTFILEKLKEFNWNISLTSKKVGLSRSQLNNLIKLFDLNREDLSE
ncbi:sigma 54-interacting transcriptional regulator [bacterium]|nr:sigma 54-interacting transcriptional regulator [bacterium]